MIKIKDAIDRIKPFHFFVFSFLFFGVVSILRVPSYILIDDEVFYLLQAKAIASGNFIWFDRTNPYLFPLILSAFVRLEFLPFLRLIPVFFMAVSAGLYFSILNKYLNKTIALIAGLFFVSHPLVIEHAIRLYTEGLLFILLFLSLNKTLEIVEEDDSWKNFLFLGFYMGLFLQVKAMIPLIPFFLTGYIFIKSKYKNILKVIVSSTVALLIYFPYFLFNGIDYFQDKLHPVFNILEIISRGSLGVEALGFSTTFLFVIALFLSLRKRKEKRGNILNIFLLFSSIYVFFILFVIGFVESRYYILCLPIVFIFISRFIFYDNLDNKKKNKIPIILSLLLFLLVSFSSVSNLPKYSRNFHFLKDNKSNYVELRYASQKYIYKNIFANDDWIPNFTVVDKIINSEIKKVCLPVFDQEFHTIARYDFNFLTEKEFSYLFIAHVCDKARIFLDGKPILKDWGGNAFGPLQEKFDYPLKPGQHVLTIDIFQGDNIGGIGQVLLSEISLLPQDNPEYFWISRK